MMIGSSLRMPLGLPGKQPQNALLATSPGPPAVLAMPRERSGASPRDERSAGSEPPPARFMASADASYSLSKLLFSAQDPARTGGTEGNSETAKQGKVREDTAATFRAMSGMSLPEKIRAELLRRKNLDEASLAKMDPDKRAAVEREIQKEVLRMFGTDTAGSGQQDADPVSTTADAGAAGRASVAGASPSTPPRLG